MLAQSRALLYRLISREGMRCLAGIALLLLSGCTLQGSNSLASPATPPSQVAQIPSPSPTALEAPTLPAPQTTVTSTVTPPTLEPAGATTVEELLESNGGAVSGIDRGPFAMTENHCGVRLPVLAPLQTDVTAVVTHTGATEVLSQVPETVRSAVQYLFSSPDNVALVAYEVGQEDKGIFLNADAPRPLASVIKVVHLVAYANAVEEGILDPERAVPLADLERFYLPNSDLGAHPRAVAALQDEGRVFGQPPSVLLEDVPRMMIEYSSNAATDYLHMLLGQEIIEETAIELGMTQQTAPCPFLGQFLLMGRGDERVTQIQQYLQEPRLFSRDVISLTEQYSTDDAFRAELGGWRGRDRRPSIEVQSLYSEALNAHGSARDYAALMAKIALNEFDTWEESVRVRRYMEWPTHFPDNQERLAWLGYKGGSLPGILTVVYYAQPWDTVQPVVVALFIHDLPQQTYRQWRRELPHDELARWLLSDRQAIPLLRTLLNKQAVSAGTP